MATSNNSTGQEQRHPRYPSLINRSLECDHNLTDDDNYSDVSISDITPIGLPITTSLPGSTSLNGLPSLERRNREEELLARVARKYDIKPNMAVRLLKLRGYEIFIVCDDSGSMTTPIFEPHRTRWSELCHIVKIVLEISSIFDTNGVDVKFLNDDNVYNVKNTNTVNQLFSRSPSGFTPLASNLEAVFQLPISRRGRDKKLLVFVATDGAPTDEDGNENIGDLEIVMNTRRNLETTFVSFLICTDEPQSVRYLEGWDRTMTNVDVTDGFFREREKVRRSQGPDFPFSMGDYIVKALIGAIDAEIDAIDDIPDDSGN